jgi:CHRD domain-containing protein
MWKPLSIAAVTVLCVCASAQADTVLTAILTNAQEPGNIAPTTSAGAPRTSSGQATFVLNDAMTSMTMTVTVLGIDFGGQSADTNDNLANAHIHASSDPNFTPPTNAGVVWGFFGAPQNDINPNDVVITPLAVGVGGTITGKWDAAEGNGTTLTAQIPNILAGRSYINFHTSQFPGGELRGAIIAIPEPGTVTLLVCGFFGFGAVALRRRQMGAR